jgi:hypothetical protein
MTGALEPLDWSVLLAELRRSVVKVAAGNRTVGTGFAITHDVVLTCRHVVGGLRAGEPVTVYLPAADGGLDTKNPLKAVVDQALPEPVGPYPGGRTPEPDLALLRLDEPGLLQAVVLDDSPVRLGASMGSFGWADDSAVGGQERVFTVTGSDENERGDRFIRVGGENLVGGLSGSPVIDDDGFVRGYVRISRAKDSPLGGWVVPVRQVLGQSETLAGIFRAPGPSIGRWPRLMTAERLRSRKRTPAGERSDAAARPAVISLAIRPVGAGAGRWQVAATGPATLTVSRQERNLGRGVFEALTSWSRRHPTPDKAEIANISGLLGQALLPTEVSNLVERHAAGSPGNPVVRVAYGEQTLDQAPWEYAATALDGVPLAARENLVMSRWVQVPTVPLPPTPRIKILVVVLGVRGHDGWLGRRDLSAAALDRAATIAGDRFDPEVLQEPDLAELESRLDERWDVVHFIGPAASRADLLTVGSGPRDRHGAREGTEPITLQGEVRRLQDCEARAVINEQLVDSDVWSVPTPPDWQGLRATLGGSLSALVFAEHRAHEALVTRFTSTFYAAVDRGSSVEAAVQQARASLHAQPIELSPGVKDYGGFGTVTVYTGSEAGVPLLTARSSDPQPVGPPTAPPSASLPPSEAAGRVFRDPRPSRAERYPQPGRLGAAAAHTRGGRL